MCACVSTALIPAVEALSVVILAAFVMVRPRSEHPAMWKDAALVAASAFVGEASCIALYGFYAYAPGWSALFLGVPPMVACIWPAVVLSGRDVVSALWGRPAPLGVALVVLFDAALVEAVAVQVGLWSWTEGALFGVPWIGLVGWAAFALGASWVIDVRASWPMRLLTPVVVTHAVLLAAWWGGLRWGFREPVSPSALAAGSAVAALVCVASLWHRRATVHWRVLAPRAAAASLFFALLAMGEGGPWLAAFALPFAAPYLTVARWRTSRGPLSHNPSVPQQIQCDGEPGNVHCN
jgi:hypothetical protein